MAREIKFLKMDGLGNDFVIFDSEQLGAALTTQQITRFSSRDNKTTFGCDQIGVIEESNIADCFLRIYNGDGSQVNTCGNIIRCVAKLLMEKYKKGAVSIETKAGVRYAALISSTKIKVDMGEPDFQWQNIPLTHMVNTLSLPIGEGELQNPAAVNVGNPHAVFFVDNVDAINLEKYGALLENNNIFMEKANIGVAHIVGDDLIRLRVFERGVGETQACGSGACAALVTAHKRGLCGRDVTIKLPGGELEIHWQDDNNIMMIGPANLQFEGTLYE